jgi:glycosyltransferase involved in cell wall biosynthesis
VPDAHLRLIGKGLDPSGLPSDLGIEPVGYVDDVAGALVDATVGVVPVRLGTGIRCKLLEFLSIGLASVSTGLGVHGLPVVDGEHVLIRDDPDHIAAAIVTLIEEPQVRRRITAAASEVASTLTWDHRVNQLDGLLQKLVEGSIR